jgi:lyso-ornithine lipid O-acyltransferase
MNRLRAIKRGLFLLWTIAGIVARLSLHAQLKGFDLEWALSARQKWVHRALRILGVEAGISGTPPEGPCIFIGNHRSYLDPVITLRDVRAIPVAKSEVASWPLIGYGGHVSGIMYVKRESKRSRAGTIEAMRQVLLGGHAVLVYPEGTTHIQPTTLPLRTGAFRLAVEEDVPVVPVALEYGSIEDAWYGDDTFVPHFLRCFGKKKTFVKMRYGQPISGNDAQALARQARLWLDENLVQMRREFDKKPHTTAAV